MTTSTRVDLGADFRGQIQMTSDVANCKGRTEWWLTSGRVDEDARSFFGQAHCHWLAGAIASVTGWDIVTVDQQFNGAWQTVHSAVRAPGGTLLDIYGEHHSPWALARKYHRDNGGADTRTRTVSNEHMPGDVITGADELRGDSTWWAAFAGGKAYPMLLHFARTVLQDAGYGEAIRPEARSGMHTQQRADSPSTSAPQSTTTSSSIGGTAMSSVDEIKGAVMQVQQDSTQILGAAQQALEDIDRIRGVLGQAFTGAEHAAAGEALAALNQAEDFFRQAHQMVHVGINAAESYALGL